MDLALAERGLLGQFTGIYPLPRSMANWVQKNWQDLIKGKLTHYFCGRGFYAFLFEAEEDRDLTFKNGPYFFNTRGMYLNKRTPDFNPELDVPFAIPIWVRLPHLPLHC
jgi:hypothetical protein